MVIFKTEMQPWGGTSSSQRSNCFLYWWCCGNKFECALQVGLRVTSGSRPWLFCDRENHRGVRRQSSPLPPPRDLQAEGGKVLKNTLHWSVWVTLCPHQGHLQGTQNVPPEEMGKEALRSRKVLLLLRLLNTINAAQTGCRFWQSQREIWINAEFQEWLDWDQHLQGKEMLYKLQQICVFFVRLWFHPSFFKPHYWRLRHEFIFAMCKSNLAQFSYLVLLILLFITLIILIFI